MSFRGSYFKSMEVTQERATVAAPLLQSAFGWSTVVSGKADSHHILTPSPRCLPEERADRKSSLQCWGSFFCRPKNFSHPYPPVCICNKMKLESGKACKRMATKGKSVVERSQVRLPRSCPLWKPLDCFSSVRCRKGPRLKGMEKGWASVHLLICKTAL